MTRQVWWQLAYSLALEMRRKAVHGVLRFDGHLVSIVGQPRFSCPIPDNDR